MRTMARRPRQLMMAGLVLAVAACSGATTFWEAAGDFESGMGAFRYAGANRDFRVSIVGNPFAVPQARTDRALVAAMQGRDKGMHTNFTTTPRNAYDPWHIVMLFNPVGDPDDGCRDPDRYARQGPARTLSIVAMFCEGDRTVYAVGGRRPAVSGPDDPAFDDFVNNLMNYFVPYESMIDDDPDDDDGGM